MNPENQSPLDQQLENLADTVKIIAKDYQKDPVELLRLLRTLESLHRHIQEGIFQDALPSNRQALYSLLRDMEENGGWPYIPRMKVESLMSNMSSDDGLGESTLVDNI